MNSHNVIDFKGNAPALNAIKLALKSKSSFYVYGHDGTGKSSLVDFITQAYDDTDTNSIVLSATVLYGSEVRNSDTIASFLKLREHHCEYGATLDDIEYSQSKTEAIRELQTIIIYEASTVSAQLLDVLDKQLKAIRNSTLPFGGIQMLFIGDHFVYKPFSFYKSNCSVKPTYFFESTSFKALRPLYISIKEDYDDIDRQLLEFTLGIRKKKNVARYYKKLKKIVEQNERHSTLPTLALRRSKKDVCAINDLKFSENVTLHSEGAASKIRYSDHFDVYGDIIFSGKHSFLGGQIKFLKDDSNGNYRKWEMATNIQTTHGGTIQLSTGRVIEIAPEITRFENKIKRRGYKLRETTITNFVPYDFCWALTIYETHGVRLQRIKFQLGNRLFSNGEVHIALTRCKSLDALTFSRPLFSSDLLAPPEVYEFDEMIGGEDEALRLRRALSDIDSRSTTV